MGISKGDEYVITETSTKKPSNWTKIGGSSQSRVAESMQPKIPLSSTEYPSLPPAPPQSETGTDWTNAKGGGKRVNYANYVSTASNVNNTSVTKSTSKPAM